MITVTQLARRCGLSRSTVLYYESVRVLKPRCGLRRTTVRMARKTWRASSRFAFSAMQAWGSVTSVRFWTAPKVTRLAS